MFAHCSSFSFRYWIYSYSLLLNFSLCLRPTHSTYENPRRIVWLSWDCWCFFSNYNCGRCASLSPDLEPAYCLSTLNKNHFGSCSNTTPTCITAIIFRSYRACGEGANKTQTWQKTNANIMTPHSLCQHASECGHNPLAGWRNGTGVLCVMGHAASRKETRGCKHVQISARRKDEHILAARVKKKNNPLSMLLQPNDRCSDTSGMTKCCCRCSYCTFMLSASATHAFFCTGSESCPEHNA